MKTDPVIKELPDCIAWPLAILAVIAYHAVLVFGMLILLGWLWGN